MKALLAALVLIAGLAIGACGTVLADTTIETKLDFEFNLTGSLTLENPVSYYGRQLTCNSYFAEHYDGSPMTSYAFNPSESYYLQYDSEGKAYWAQGDNRSVPFSFTTSTPYSGGHSYTELYAQIDPLNPYYVSVSGYLQNDITVVKDTSMTSAFGQVGSGFVNGFFNFVPKEGVNGVMDIALGFDTYQIDHNDTSGLVDYWGGHAQVNLTQNLFLSGENGAFKAFYLQYDPEFDGFDYTTYVNPFDSNFSFGEWNVDTDGYFVPTSATYSYSVGMYAVVEEQGRTGEVPPYVVPEPMTMSLMGLGLLGFGIYKKRRQ